MSMCTHEAIQLSRDGERTVRCPDCKREFGHLGRDEKETFVVYAPENHPVIVVASRDAEVGMMVADRYGDLVRKYIYRCRVCGWAMSCGENGEDCHS